MSEPIYLGPDDPLDWLRLLIGEAASEPLMSNLREFAERIRALEPSAVEQLRPDDADPDCPAEFRISNDGGGIEFHDLGRHSAAARWAVRHAALGGWWRHRGAAPSRAAHRAWAEGVQQATHRLLYLLRTAEPHDRMALQRGGLTGGWRMLPAHPVRDGEGWLVTTLQSLDKAAGADLRHLGEPNGRDRQPDRRASAATESPPTAAHDAVPIWLHFRPDACPSSYYSKSETRQRQLPGSFVAFVELLHEMATGDKRRYVRRDVQDALREHEKAISLRYSLTASAKPRARRTAGPV
jgi:hypothetical protein